MSRFTLVTTAFLVGLSLHAQPNILTSNYGNGRTNANVEETVLNPGNVSPETFGKIGAYSVDGHVFAQPLYVKNVAISGELKNVLYVATMHNSVYAFDADDPQAKEPLWQVNMGPALPTRYYRRFADIEKEIGILSTPVIDVARRAIYVVTCNLIDDKPSFALHALDLTDGAAKLGGSMEIRGSVPGSGDNSDGKNVYFDPIQHMQRPGLLLANNTIYIAFGSHNDEYPFHGWIAAYDAGNIQHQVAMFNSTPAGGYGAIWQSGRGLAADDAGNVYISTGNGDYDGRFNFSQSILKLSPRLGIIDWFTPENWSQLSVDDADLSSQGPVLIPGANQLLGGDKEGNLYVVDRTNMGRLGSKQATSPQILRAIQYGGIYNMAIWPRATGTQIYITAEGDVTSQFTMAGGLVNPTSTAQSHTSGDSPFQGMAVSANGDKDGIFWINFGDYSQDGVPAVFCALDGNDISSLLWCSNIYADRDTPGRFAKFVAPTIVNGRVYLPTFSYEIAIYGLLPEPPLAELTKRPLRKRSFKR